MSKQKSVLTPSQLENIEIIKKYVKNDRYPSDQNLKGFINLRRSYKLHIDKNDPESKQIIAEIDSHLPDLRDYIDLLNHYVQNKIPNSKRDRSLKIIRNFNKRVSKKHKLEEIDIPDNTDYFMIGIEKRIIKDVTQFKDVNINNKYLKKLFELRLEDYVIQGISNMPTSAFHEYMKMTNSADDSKETKDYLLLGFELQIFTKETIKAYEDNDIVLPEIYTETMYKAIIKKCLQNKESIPYDAYTYFHVESDE